MVIDFAFYLTLAVLVTGVIALLDICFWAKKRRQAGRKQPIIIEYARAFFPVLFIVLIIRSFVVQPYRVPTSSLVPTIVPGDFIVVKQYEYGLRLPIWNYKIFEVGEPQRGDIVLFRFPPNPKITYVKRLIGLPGDHIVYRDKVLYINGDKAEQKLLEKTHYIDENGIYYVVDRLEENLTGVKHQIIVQPIGGEIRDYDVVVPPNHYFMMGDNRDNSGDSRSWGFVPEENLIGQAFVVFMSWDTNAHWPNKFRWHRFGEWIH